MKILSNDQLLKILTLDTSAKMNMTDKGGGLSLSSWNGCWNRWISQEIKADVNFTPTQNDRLYRKAIKLSEK